MPADLHPFTRLTPDEVMNAVESVGYRCDARILELNSYENRVYQIGIEDTEPLVGKFYRPDRWTDEAIVEEHEFTLTLYDADVSVVPPIDLGDGETLKHYNDFRFALYPRRGGRAPDIDNLENLTILGRHIGRIHSVGAAHTFRYRPDISVQEYGHAARDYLLANDFIPGELNPAYESVSAGVLEALGDLFSDVRRIRLHGDCHMGNVLWRDNVPHFVDFDDARNGPAIQDLWMMLSGEYEMQGQQMAAILRGYRDFYDFDYRELRLIEPLRTLRIMYHAAWLARRWDDPAFPRAFPYFNTERYWSEHVLELREQWSKLGEPALQVYD
jgi:Ser/Thr protein kinase RdoA (MazF antagonist)